MVNREASPRLLAAANAQRADVGAQGFSIANPIQTLLFVRSMFIGAFLNGRRLGRATASRALEPSQG